MSNDTRDLRALAQEAYDIQNACNLSGVVHSFSRSISRLRELLEAESLFTKAVNEHPICVLFADKIAQLTETQTIGNDRVMAAYSHVRKMLEQE